MKNTSMIRISIVSVLCLICLSQAIAQQANTKNGGQVDTLYQNFLSPSNASRPRVWWHWMNANITKDGIRKDLLWMHRSGIGGFQNFDASMLTPQIVDKRLAYMTPEWKDAFRYATTLADSLNLEMAIAGSPGWSESGGPWVKPEDGMKKIVWTETFVKGGSSNVKLPQPSGNTGPIQNLPKSFEFGQTGSGHDIPSFYKDVAVIAYRLPASETPLAELNPKVSSSGGNFSLAQLIDGDLATTNLLPRDTVSGYAWIQFEFKSPATIRAITIVGGGDRGPFGLFGELKDTRMLEASDDGKNFKHVAYIPAGNVLQQTISIPPATAKYFRVRFKNLPPVNAFGGLMGDNPGPPKPPAGVDVGELVLHTNARINWAEEKSAFAPATRLDKKISPPGDAVLSTDLIDLSSRLKADGSLDWTAPSGKWNVMRFGYSLIGKTNHPASPEATGLEVDKLDSAAVKRYFTNYLDQYKNATDGLMGKNGGLQYMVTDSWEAGAQNWTPNMISEFPRRRGYSILPWMPVLSGRIIGSTEESEKFLFDFRKTLSEMVAEYHYDELTKILESYGMKRYSESHEDGRAMIADGMEVKRTASIPMSAMWTPNPFMNQNNQTKYEADIRESASVAHIYGQNIVAAESLTALGYPSTAWTYSPENLKPTADLELANGLNRFVIHTSVHQPVDDKVPGIGLGPFGQWFNRHDTWSENAKAWTDYLSRSCYLLQQGKFVADVLVYYGEDSNITALYRDKSADVPDGYNYDFINSDALLHLLEVKDGDLVTPSGMRYRLLVLDSNAVRLRVPVLAKIRDLVKAGARIAGVKPVSSLSLSDNGETFSRLVSEVWESGSANVSTGSIQKALADLDIAPDFSYQKTQSNARILFVHRTIPGSEIYWVNNRSAAAEKVEATFRVSGLIPEIWHPENGKIENVPYRIENGKTNVTLDLSPADAVFVVFRKKALSTSVKLPPSVEKELRTLDGNWEIRFQSHRGAPATTKVAALKSWTENAEPGIRYFSGTGTYVKQIEASKAWFQKGQKIVLDLGDVKNIAEVIVNGKSVGVIWKQPFQIDVTNSLKQGTNTLEIKVTNLWVNRLIGDLQPGVSKKITYTTQPFYQADSALLPSGLLGPVRILAKSE
jgi:hypothetical protein